MPGFRKTALTASVVVALAFLSVAASGATVAGAAARKESPCSGANLVGAFARSDTYAGGGIITLALTNIGASNCTLGGYPKLIGIRGGREYALTHVGHGTQDSDLGPTTLTPRQSGALILDNSLGCNANVYPLKAIYVFTGIVIVLPKDQGIVKVLGVPLSDPCGLSESELGWATGFNYN